MLEPFTAGIRTMYDGINADAAAIHSLWQPGSLVGYYTAGNSYIWTQAEKAMFPESALVGITLTAASARWEDDVLDIERGGATVDEAADWIRRKKESGYFRPTLYASLAIIPSIRVATGKYILGRDYDIWVADWDGTTSVPYPMAAAKQYSAAGKYDKSAVYDELWPHRRDAPPPPSGPDPVLHAGSVKYAYVRVPGTRPVYLYNGHSLWHVTDPAVLQMLETAGLTDPIQPVSAQVLNSLGPVIS